MPDNSQINTDSKRLAVGCFDLFDCPFCSSSNVEYEGGITQSATIEWESGAVVCQECGAQGSDVHRNTRDDEPWGNYGVHKLAVDNWNNASIPSNSQNTRREDGTES